MNAADNAIDLRSDTITEPTEAMRAAIAQAEVGDDVFGDDPSVAELEELTANTLGKEAAVFVPSGTMANQIAVRCHAAPGDRVCLESEAHIYRYEAGAMSALSGVIPHCMPGRRGVFTREQFEDAVTPDDVHYAPTTLVCLENTHNRSGGSLWPMPGIREISAVASRHGVRRHLDGARLWNAAAATGLSEREYAQHFDSVSVCFSKGLGAPVGSALAGDAAFIHRARRARKMFGGGMRQAGLLAAGAAFALRHHRERLKEDHKNAARLAAGLSDIPGLETDAAAVATNIVVARTANHAAAAVQERLERRGVRALAIGPRLLRAVTSLMVTAPQIDKAVDIIRSVMMDPDLPAA